jgi:CBS domain-containing protein
MFIMGGIFSFFLRNAPLSGIWLAFIGWFLLTAADQSWKQTEIRGVLGTYTVSDLVTPFYSWTTPEQTLEEYFSRLTDNHDYRASLVIDDDQLVGVIAPVDLRGAPRPQWSSLQVRNLMVPAEKVVSVTPDQPLTDALEKMVNHNVSQLPVLQEKKIRGVIRRDRIVQLLQSQLLNKDQSPTSG